MDISENLQAGALNASVTTVLTKRTKTLRKKNIKNKTEKSLPDPSCASSTNLETTGKTRDDLLNKGY